MKRLTSIVALIVLAPFSTPSVSAQPAQPAQPATYLNIVTLEIDGGQRGVFEEYERRISEARERVAEQGSANVHRVRAGGPLNVYYVVRGFDTAAEMESWLPIGELLRTAFGESEGSRILEEGAASIRSISNAIRAYQPEFSSRTDACGPGTFVHVVTTEVDPRLDADYVAMLQSLAQAEREAGFCRTRRTTRVGQMFTYEAVHTADSIDELLSGPGPRQLLQETYGEQLGAALWDRSNAAVVNRRIEIVERMDELSYVVE